MDRWDQSVIWSEEFFGPVGVVLGGTAEDGSSQVENNNKELSGRWGDVMVPRNNSDAVGDSGQGSYESHNAYGFRVRPYNLNPSQHVTRDFAVCGLKMGGLVKLPGCKEQLGTFESKSITELHVATEFPNVRN